MEGGRDVIFKAVAKFRRTWGLTLAASGEWREKAWWGVRGGVLVILQGQNGPNLTTYWIWEQGRR